MKKIIYLISSIFIVVLAGCSNDTESPSTKDQDALTRALKNTHFLSCESEDKLKMSLFVQN